MAEKIGVLLCNIGTPRSYAVRDVKNYLLRFLMDKDIINLPFPLRWLLVHGIIVPRRAAYSAENYKKIWTPEGSPLWVYSQHFAEKLQNELGPNFKVKLGMRYSEPSIENSLKEFADENIESLILAPMFPQYAEATTGSIIKAFTRAQRKLNFRAPTKIVRDFYNLEGFIKASAEALMATLPEGNIDHYLFSFHGLPESHVRKNPGCLRSDDCCFDSSACTKPCYRAQCFETASRMAEHLQIPPSHWSVSFQSRLGRGEWLKPATDHTLEVLAQTGKKSIAVLCPSFVADCIETLEEIAMGGKELFQEAGGVAYHAVPCVNADDLWVREFAAFLRKTHSSSV